MERALSVVCAPCLAGCYGLIEYCLPATCCGQDADEVFAYETPKMVILKDRKLGVLKLVLTMLIVAYCTVDIMFLTSFNERETPGITISFWMDPSPDYILKYRERTKPHICSNSSLNFLYSHCWYSNLSSCIWQYPRTAWRSATLLEKHIYLTCIAIAAWVGWLFCSH